MLNDVSLALTASGLIVAFWQYVHGERKQRREIDSLKEEKTGAIQRCRTTAILFGSLALFLFALLLVASRKTA